jgi:hypothetical protein
MEHRKKALENLVHLHLANYYSSPKAPNEDKEKVQEMTKKVVRSKGRK